MVITYCRKETQKLVAIRIALLTVLREVRHATDYQMKATEWYFSVVLFIMLYKVVLTFESVGEILKRDHSNESY